MTLDQATRHIQSCARQMNDLYHKVVFDEWAIVSISHQKVHLLDYLGPRRESFTASFATDASSLRTGLMAQQYNPGDFEFSRHGVGTGFESFMMAGPGTYIICNNTGQSMDAIAKDPHWLEAQIPFADLSEVFRADPLVLPAGTSAIGG